MGANTWRGKGLWYGLFGVVLGACIAGGAAFAVPGDIGAAPPTPPVGDCVEGAVTAVTTVPCGFGMLAGTTFVADMTWLGQALALKIEKGAAGVEAGQKEIIAAMGKMGDAQVARRNQTVRNQTETQAALNLNQQIAGPLGDPQAVCASSDVPDTILSGYGSYARFHAGLNRAMAAWPSSFLSHRQVIDTLAATNGPDQQGMSPKNIYNPPSAASSAQYISVVTDGMPKEYVDPKKMSPTSRARYEAYHAVWAARVGVAREALNYLAAEHKVTMTVKPWVAASYTSIGETPPAEISERELDRVLAERQIASPTWRTAIATLGTVGVLRRIALMKAADLQIHDDMLNDMDRLLALAAAQYSHQIQGEQPSPQAAELGQPSTSGGSK